MAKSKADLLREIKKLQGELNQLEKVGTSLTEEQIKLQDKLKGQIVSRAREVKKINEEQIKAKQIVIDGISEQEKGIKSLSGIYSPIGRIEQKRVNALRESGTEHKKNIASLSTMQSLNEKIANLSANDAIQRESLQSQFNQELASLDKRGKGIEEQIALMTQSNQLANNYAGLTDKQKQFLEKQRAVLEGIQDTIGGVLETAKLLTSNLRGGVGMALIGAGFFADKLGDSIKETGGFVQGVSVQAGALSFLFKDATQNAVALTKELGGTEQVTLGAQLQTNILANNLGISGQEAASLTGAFARLNNGSTSVAGDLMVSTRELAKANGVIPSAAMSDLAQNTELFAKFGAEGGKNIAEAAVFAQKLGSSLQSVTSVADSLLDFDSSINSELELSALLGRQINLDRARALAFEGDLTGAVQETIKQLGGVAEFERMNVIQRQEAAKALGISVGELEKMVKNMDDVNGEASIFEKGLNKAKEAATFIGTTVGGKILKGLGAAVTATGQFGMGMRGIGDGMKAASSGIDAVSSKVKSMSKASQGTDMVSKTTKNAGTSLDKGGKASKGGMGIGKGLKSLSEGLKSMGTGKVLFGALNLIPTSLGFIAILPGIPGMIAVSLLGGPAGVGLRLLGQGMSAFGKLVAQSAPFIALGILALAGLGASLIPLGYALAQAAPAISAFGDVLLGAFTGISTIITAAANGLVSLMSVITIEKATAMLMLAGSLGTLGLALGGFSLALAAAGVGGLLGGGIFNKINELVEQAEPLRMTASAMQLLASSIQSISSSLGTLSLEKLEALQDFKMNPVEMGIQAVSQGISGAVQKVSSLGGGEEGVGTTGGVGDTQNQLIQRLDTLIQETRQNRDVFIDGTKVTSLITQTQERSTENRAGLQFA